MIGLARVGPSSCNTREQVYSSSMIHWTNLRKNSRKAPRRRVLVCWASLGRWSFTAALASRHIDVSKNIIQWPARGGPLIPTPQHGYSSNQMSLFSRSLEREPIRNSQPHAWMVHIVNVVKSFMCFHVLWCWNKISLLPWKPIYNSNLILLYERIWGFEAWHRGGEFPVLN